MIYSYRPMVYIGVDKLCVEYNLQKYLSYVSLNMGKVIEHIKSEISGRGGVQIKRSKYHEAVREMNSSRYGLKTASNLT